mmetsp:Transcript_44112/g.136170  ORF Transcript_44112/g.136170 Transcript_44112/m.136170 type:complete len:202 (+) Transcript_44112:495-1100(+)
MTSSRRNASPLRMIVLPPTLSPSPGVAAATAGQRRKAPTATWASPRLPIPSRSAPRGNLRMAKARPRLAPRGSRTPRHRASKWSSPRRQRRPKSARALRSDERLRAAPTRRRRCDSGGLRPFIAPPAASRPAHPTQTQMPRTFNNAATATPLDLIRRCVAAARVPSSCRVISHSTSRTRANRTTTTGPGGAAAGASPSTGT